MNDRGNNKNGQSGSLNKSEPEFLVAGKLRRSHGLDGEMWMEVITDFPDLLKPGITIFIGENHQNILIRSFKIAGKLGLIRFEGYENPESLRSFSNAYLYFECQNLPELPKSEYYHHQLLGILVKDEAGNIIGTLTDILETGANDVYVISPADGKDDILIPAIKTVIKKIDIESNLMIAHPPEWEK
jgi:16S rRNA processing protein RimM